MKVANIKRLPRFAAVLIFTAIFCVAATANVWGAQPYFKVFGGDVMSGGWFADTAVGCPTGPSSNFQDPWTATTGTVDQNGGIAAYAKENAAHQSTGGASSQYGAFALGTIDGTNTNYGFYSAGALAASSTVPIAKNLLSFSNTTNKSTWGGQWGGNVRQAHCIPDYFSTKKQIGSKGFPGIDSATSGQYWVDGPTTPYSITGGSVGAGKKITLFVSGNVYISGNITYAASSTYTVDQIPKFTLIAQGSIYIAGNVTQLDGVYIAQPDLTVTTPMTKDTGNIWTCHDGSTIAYNTTGITANCASKLTVNGALIAKQVNLLRTVGDVIGATTGETAGSANVAEIINQTPETVIGGPVFYNLSSNPDYTIDALINLPPVF